MAAIFLAVAVVLSACAHEAPTRRATTITTLHEDAIRKGWSSQEQLLADGEVTKEDLRTAFADYRSCIEALGFTLSEPMVNRVDGWRLLAEVSYNGITDQGTQDKAADCSASQMSLIEIGYEVTHRAQMDQPLMGEVRQCMERRNLTTTGTERDVSDLVAGDRGRLPVIVLCVQAGAHKLYPKESTALAY